MIAGLYERFRELFWYGVFDVLTTIINTVFWLFSDVLSVHQLCQRQISYRFVGYGPDVFDDFNHRSTEDVGKAGIECGSDHRQLCAE